MNGKPLDAIFVCCGGGGMLAGIAAYVKRVRPQVMVIGVEAEDGTLKPHEPDTNPNTHAQDTLTPTLRPREPSTWP